MLHYRPIFVLYTLDEVYYTLTLKYIDIIDVFFDTVYPILILHIDYNRQISVAIEFTT
jgi:hypothetical protein